MDELFLIEPNIEYQDSFKDYALAYKKINDTHYYNKYKKALVNFQEYLDEIYNYSRGIDIPHGEVMTSVFWLIYKKDVVGVVRIRHKGLEYAGHIGYDVAPRFRNKGYGSLMLKLALEKAVEIGIEEVVITCSVGNIASKKIIQKNNGKLLTIVYDRQEDEHLYKFIISTKYGF